MNTMYLDITDNSCMSVFVKDVNIVPAGTTVYSMQVKDKNDEYDALARRYDIHFIFDDDIPAIDFYSVPHIDIMASDSQGGFLGTMGEVSGLDDSAPICYIDSNKKIYIIASDFRELLKNPDGWRERCTPCEEAAIFTSKEEAMKKLKFVDLKSFENMEEIC